MAYQMLLLEAGLLAYLIAGTFGTFGYMSFLYLHLALISAITTVVRQDLRAGEAESTKKNGDQRWTAEAPANQRSVRLCLVPPAPRLPSPTSK